MTDLAAAIYGPIYSTLGVPAVLSMGTDEFGLTVIDKTSGALVDAAVGASRQLSAVQLQTVKPCADVRMTELAAASIALANLRDSSLTFNGKTWRINSFAYRPGPAGEASGEIRMILMEPNA